MLDTKALLERARRAWNQLGFGPARTGLRMRLALTNVLIVALVVSGISFSAISLLRNLADGQGRARVLLAGALAREDVRRYGEDVLTSARVLAERPTLQRLLAEGRNDAIEPVLRRSCDASDIDACAMVQGTTVLAQAGAALPWSEIIEAGIEQGERFLAAPRDGSEAVLGAMVPLSSISDTRVVVVRLLDGKLAKILSERVGLELRLINYNSFTKAAVDEFTSLHTAGLADSRSAVQRIEPLDLYAASIPVFASTGEAIALIEIRLPTAEIDTAVDRLVTRLLITAIVLALLAVLAGVIFGQQVAGPVRALTDAAVRLGEGDFSTSIPTGGPAELGKLAQTMENMRRSLIELTGALRQREAEARAVLGGIVEGVYAVDRTRTIRYLNPQAARLLGITPDEAIGRFCGDVLQPRGEDGRRPCEVHCPIVQARSDGSSTATERLAPADGIVRTTVITSAAPVDGLQVQVIRDETELEGVRRARDSVLANISHEFRTPLAAQLASIELLREGLENMPPQQSLELVRSLERGTLRLTRLIDNLLESVRIESGQLGIRHQRVVLAEVVEDARALIGSLLTQRNQKLELSLPEDLPPIDGDGSRLTQVFVNLLANATKFAPEGSTVRIGAALEGGRMRAWVEDEGPGVPEINAGSIFDRFNRGPELEPEPGGLGLGLWIVKSIVDRHGGTVSALRTAEQRTRLSITLPLAGAE